MEELGKLCQQIVINKKVHGMLNIEEYMVETEQKTPQFSPPILIKFGSE